MNVHRGRLCQTVCRLPLTRLEVNKTFSIEMNFLDSVETTVNHDYQDRTSFESIYESNGAFGDFFSWTYQSQSQPGTTSFFEGIQETSKPPKRRMEANARERDRTMSVNTAFAMLRSLIPTEPKNRKLSKIEILRLASSYINHLNNLREARLRGDYSNDSPYRPRPVCTFCLTNKKRSRITFSVTNEK